MVGSGRNNREYSFCRFFNLTNTIFMSNRYYSFSVLLLISTFLFFSCSTESTPVYTLSTSVNNTEAGSVSPSSGEFDEGENVEITATPSDDWIFDSWEGDASGNDNPTTVKMDSDKDVAATFVLREYPLTVEIEGEGTVQENVVQEKTTDYEAGTVVELTAEPADGWRFTGWDGDLEGTENPQSITVDSDKSITANFERRDYPLTIQIEGKGTVEEEVVQAKTTDYPFETEVKLTANATDGWEFVGWQGDLEGDENTQQITVDDAKTVTAVFEIREYPLTVNVEGEGSVQESVLSQKTTNYEEDTIVELIAEPEKGWQFTGWEGDLTGSENPAKVEINQEKHVKAIFEERRLDLNVFADGNGDINKNLISGNEDESGLYEFNSVVELVAKPDAEWKFSHWEGDFTGRDHEVEVTLDTDKNIVAVFQAEESNEINLLVGDSHRQAFPGGSVILPDEAGVVFRVGVMARDYQKNGATVLDVPNDMMLNVREVGSGLAKSSTFTHRDSYQAPYKDDKIDDETWELMQRTQEVHQELRKAEQNRTVKGMNYTSTGEPSRLGAADRMKVNSGAEPEENRTFFAGNPDGGARIEIEATLRKNGTNIIYYQDDSVEGTGEEATDQEIEDLLEYYDQYGKPLIDEMFGGLGPDGTTNYFSGGERMANDIDGNGKFIVLQLHADNMIGGAAGYVSLCDRFPLEENYNAGPFYCEKSNEAEITYLLRPDSDFFLGALVHEAKHISSHGYAVFTDRELQPSWMEEGTAEIANEMASRRASGIADHQEVTYSDIYPGGSTTALTDAMASVNARARNFLYASPESGIIGDPDENSANSDYYGSGWLFHRYLADNYAENNQNRFFRELNDGTRGDGLQSLTSATGKQFDELLDEFTTVIQIEGYADAKTSSSVSFSSYNFEEIASNFTMGDWPYLYGASDYSTGEVALSPVYYTSPVLFEFTSPGGSTLELELLDGDGESLNAEHDGALIITRVE